MKIMKVVFLGNSLVEGSYGGNFVAEVAARLVDYTIINAGQNGNTMMNLLDRLDTVLAHQPDGVFILGGGNDAISYSQPETRRFYERAMRVPLGLVTPEMFTLFSRDLLARIQLANSLVWVGLTPMEYNPATVTAAQQYNSILAEICERFNVPTLDLMSILAPKSVPERPPLDLKAIQLIGQRIASGWNDYEAERVRGGFTYTFDGLHLMPESAKRVGEIVAAFISQ